MLYVICIHTLGFSIRGGAPSVRVISCFLKPANYGAQPCRITGSCVKSLANPIPLLGGPNYLAVVAVSHLYGVSKNGGSPKLWYYGFQHQNGLT